MQATSASVLVAWAVEAKREAARESDIRTPSVARAPKVGVNAIQVYKI
jgi:hypothetical protein